MAKKSIKEVEKVDAPAQSLPSKDVEVITDWSRSGMQNHTVPDPEFTGVARSVVCFHNQGHNNFRILTLYIEKGKVVKMDVSDPYAQWEAIQQLERWNSSSLFHLNLNWKDGGAWSK